MPEISLAIQSFLFYFILLIAAVVGYVSLGLITLKAVLENVIPEELRFEVEPVSEDKLLKMIIIFPVYLVWILYKWFRYKPEKDKFKNGL